ncbi:uncharacterized protein LOC143919801 [Arctopsyche grandis]|uniref:uncharacterized protein LOC143919801 n=1 Tax=Arctopsyche grandis TaxID=121162 RepID=UPI00406D756A
MECRLCMSLVPTESSVLIYENPVSLELQERIWSCCRLQLTKHDTLPDSICSLCNSKVESLMDFKNICRQNDVKARKKMPKCLDIKVEEILLDNLVWEDERFDTDSHLKKFPNDDYQKQSGNSNRGEKSINIDKFSSRKGQENTAGNCSVPSLTEEEGANDDTSSSETTPYFDLPPTPPYLPPPSPDIPPYDNTSMPSPQCTIKRKRSKITAVPRYIEETINTLKELKEKVVTDKKIEDEFAHFGKNLACQLRQLPIVDALDCQSEIFLLLKQKRELNSTRQNNCQIILSSDTNSSYT